MSFRPVNDEEIKKVRFLGFRPTNDEKIKKDYIFFLGSVAKKDFVEGFKKIVEAAESGLPGAKKLDKEARSPCRR
ncbi:hypothetical protein F8M41_017107 [Gigaspora margarita]|uniref:Uncharacterized protein n=1 Tax=Gigaspora margarita TaxID=4874 RepID=A0A8H4ANJ3_GIGMA|nr:hypothetical protein F8M41_017107 [Gigaspora margarita]